MFLSFTCSFGAIYFTPSIILHSSHGCIGKFGGETREASGEILLSVCVCVCLHISQSLQYFAADLIEYSGCTECVEYLIASIIIQKVSVTSVSPFHNSVPVQELTRLCTSCAPRWPLRKPTRLICSLPSLLLQRLWCIISDWMVRSIHSCPSTFTTVYKCPENIGRGCFFNTEPSSELWVSQVISAIEVEGR